LADAAVLPTLEPEWNGLLDADPDAELFQTPEWLAAWLASFWAGRPLAFLLVRAGDGLDALAPLLRDADGALRCPGSLALPTDAMAWRGAVAQRDSGAGAVEAVLDYLEAAGPFRLTLGRIAADGATSQALRQALQGRRLRSVWREDLATPYIRLTGSLDDYLKSRSRHVRHEYRRKAKRLEGAGTVVVEVATTADHLRAAMDAVCQIERHSWKERAGSSFLGRPGAEAFYRRLFERGAVRGWGRIYLMRLNDAPIAYVCGMAYRDRYYAFNCAFDARFGALSPGAVLMLRVIEDVVAQGCEVLDFLGSEYRWKRELCTDLRPHVSVCVFSRLASRCGVCWMMDQHLKPYARAHLPTLVRARQRVRAALKR
jgi:CelD/BcsL family acetyltransferase involved in cellulose biosynthesis